MVSSYSPTETTARKFAARFGDKAFADVAELLIEDGHKHVVEGFPDEFQEGQLDAKDTFKQYWWGLYGQYGDFEGVGEVAAENSEVTVKLHFADGSEIATVNKGNSTSGEQEGSILRRGVRCSDSSGTGFQDRTRF